MKLLARPEGRSLPLILAAAVLISTSPIVTGCSRGEDQPAAAQPTQAEPSVVPTAAPAPPPPAASEEPGPPPGAATPQELQELVSPIALYPDVLVAQILAGSTYPTQVVEADRWLKQNPNLKGDQLASQVNQQAWDPSIKSLTQFPTVLATMNDSLAWTSELGEAYYNQPTDVMNAIQTLRNMAMAAGTLKSNDQQKVEVQPAPPAPQGAAQPSMQQTVIIQPAQPNTVYVPQYNPTSAYGAPVAAPAGYSGTDLLLTGVLSFGAGVLLGSLINNGHNDWGCNWYGGGGSSVKYNNNVYVTNNNVYPGRYPAGGGGYRPPGYRPPNGGYPARPGYPNNRPPYNGGGGYNRPNNPGVPATRPYDKKTARPANPDFAKPNFPKPSTLPNNPGGSNSNRPGGAGTKDLGKNRPNQPSNPAAGTRPANPSAGNRPAAKPADRSADPARGFAPKDKSSTGGRNSALGGYEPGSNARASGDRGQASFKGNQNAGGGRGNGGGGGNRGGGDRGGGGGNGGARWEKGQMRYSMKSNRTTTECLETNLRRTANIARSRPMMNHSSQSRIWVLLTRQSIALSAILLATLLLPHFASAQDAAAQQVFPTPGAAAKALAAASKADDMKALGAILGPDADEILSSGDPVADKNARDDFARHYDEMHRFERDDQGRVIMYIGAGNWPTPIPLVKKGDGWVFDTAAGKEELLYRRVGKNELFTIRVLDDLADAQGEYAADGHDGEDAGLFAQKILSDSGKQNGLYWVAAEGQPESPIGPLVADATAEGYKKDAGGKPIPFHGYFYKVLTKQGPNAPGGPKNYIVDGKMTKGFAFLAYPAEYRASGVMTFMINHDGVIVQKDLGADTEKLADAIDTYNPDKTWQEVDE